MPSSGLKSLGFIRGLNHQNRSLFHHGLIQKMYYETNSIPDWKKQKLALKKKVQGGWNPKKKLPQESMDEVRQMKQDDPSLTCSVLGNLYGVSPESIRRILKASNRVPTERELKRKQQR
ncbi:mitochondrial ribosome assembly protein Rrg9 [Schizosaccharomyces osmophilus]|uniref:Required for respiratory growth protein 9, mitochondrial n=1 Tax=Schizosaccharomyces osmophilus TaxID=2545709 RepID=A0AAE9WD48_9SCHI|nr:mitochondrial ribosome assembly protein Rrg9 [Schizosaccharomyces osmophilus]WBW73995.1 mitochondrial ribosome assembly protein Rrg9 [Schizosaccharomyces osmophilus]